MSFKGDPDAVVVIEWDVLAQNINNIAGRATVALEFLWDECQEEREDSDDEIIALLAECIICNRNFKNYLDKIGEAYEPYKDEETGRLMINLPAYIMLVIKSYYESIASCEQELKMAGIVCEVH